MGLYIATTTRGREKRPIPSHTHTRTLQIPYEPSVPRHCSSNFNTITSNKNDRRNDKYHHHDNHHHHRDVFSFSYMETCTHKQLKNIVDNIPLPSFVGGTSGGETLGLATSGEILVIATSGGDT